ncbi:MAG: peptidoglycan-associated lipoprotein Pal, partial [Dongiaceae bacterium]
DIAAAADRVFFEYDSATLRPDARTTLDALASQIQKQPQCRFVVEGHCDERGTREYNLALGEKRASVVVSYLAALGVDPTRMQTTSYGKERPAVIGGGEETWGQNRRAVMVFK